MQRESRKREEEKTKKKDTEKTEKTEKTAKREQEKQIQKTDQADWLPSVSSQSVVPQFVARVICSLFHASRNSVLQRHVKPANATMVPEPAVNHRNSQSIDGNR